MERQERPDPPVNRLETPVLDEGPHRIANLKDTPAEDKVLRSVLREPAGTVGDALHVTVLAVVRRSMNKFLHLFSCVYAHA